MYKKNKCLTNIYSCEMKKLMYSSMVLLFASIISCAPKINKTFGFDRIKDFQELSGTYSGTSINSKRHLAEFNILESFFIEGEKAEKFTLSFLDDNTVVIAYQVVEEGKVIDKTMDLKGKKQNDGFYIDIERSRILVPFI